jgi:hypothetical protein
MRKSNKFSFKQDVKAFGADQTVIAPSIGSSEFVPSQYLYKEAYNNFSSHLYAPAFETGYYDIFALSREYSEDPDFNLSFNNINTNYLFSIDNFNIQGAQESDAGQRYAGEGANPNTFQLGPKEYNVSFTYPFKVDSWGYLDFSLAAFFDYCIDCNIALFILNEYFSLKNFHSFKKIDDFISNFLDIIEDKTITIRKPKKENIKLFLKDLKYGYDIHKLCDK